MYRKSLAAIALMVVAAWSFPCSAQIAKQDAAQDLPGLSVLLKPHVEGGNVDYVEIRETIQRPQVAAGGVLLRMPLIVASIPTARYDGDAIRAEDGAGELSLTQKDEPPTPSGTYRQWLAARATNGDVVLRYRAKPRAVSATTRSGPLFDLRAESGGLNGAGMTFLALPDTKTTYRLNVRWDLTDMPAGSRGVWSFGEGDASKEGTADLLADTFYAAGPLESYPADGTGNFGMYWLGNPPFDTERVAQNIQSFFTYVSKFFEDEGGSYRVFVRKNPYPRGGGTSLSRSFMFGYSDAKTPTPEELHGLLAHEIVHNWPSLEGEHGETAWYSEGTAEYYSILLSYRAGIYDSAEFLKVINGRAARYYTNPYRSLTNEQAAQKFWSDSRAQRVPYGRGFMYLARVDAELRAKSGGKRRLDDLVLAMLARQRTGQKYGVPEWIDLVTHELGPQARSEFEAMVSGKTQTPPANAFAPCFKPAPHQDQPFELGFDIASLDREDRKVRGLVAGSAAARAGLRDGDVILEADNVTEAQDHPERRFRLELKRAARELRIEYVPRGKPVASHHWVRAIGVPDASCGL